MFKKPIFNAFGASAYIFFVVAVMNYLTYPLRNKPDTYLAPITVLFVLTLSVTVMAYLFFYQPTQLFIGGKRQEAIRFFIATVGNFAILTFVVLTLLFISRF